jgi:ATP-dependent DNA helicase RecQ
MKRDALSHLGLVPDRITRITGRRRTRLINFLLRWEQYEKALACLDKMLESRPDLVGLLDAKTQALMGVGQLDAAHALIQIRHQIRASLHSRRLEARIYLARGDTESALAIAQDMVADRSESATAWGLLGEVHIARDDLDAALAAYRRLADLSPNSRAYLLGMLALHQAQGDYVIASGYAARLQRSMTEGQSLPAITLRRLRDYYLASGEANRADDIETELAALYAVELADLEMTLADDLRVLTQRSEQPPATAPAQPEGSLHDSPTEPPAPDQIPVSNQEQQRVAKAARELFGHERLLPGQAATMTTVLRNQDVLTVLPTGGGKSLCYQLPSLLDAYGTTLVISPLIALMKDQVDSLPPAARGRATTINSSLDGSELDRRMRDIAEGHYSLVYAAPERLRQFPFLHALRRASVNRLVIDEAHCVSVWGHDFRPDYLYISQARQALGNPSLLAMTATAPPRVRHDILQRLGKAGDRNSHLSNTESRPKQDRMVVVATDIYRPNLYLGAIHARNTDEKLRYLLALCQWEEGSGIVYADTRARCEQIAALLHSRGISAGYYHAGIGNRQARAGAQEQFMCGQVRVMVATIAFGMGIDKPDIRFIIHLQLPKSLEAYYQEAGRAGRDGLPARCLLIHTTSDRGTLTRRAKQSALPIEFLRTIYTAVKSHLGKATLGRVAIGDLMRDVQAEDTPVRVALSMLEEAGLLRRHQDVPTTAVVRFLNINRPRQRESTSGADAKWSAFVKAARLLPGQSLPVDPVAVARTAGLDPVEIESDLLKWTEAGWLDYRPVGRDLLLELLKPPSDTATRIEALIDRYATIQAQRVDEIAAYANTTRCRHGHISAYLTGKPMETCQSCDNCQPDVFPIKKSIKALDLPDDPAQLRTILACVADAPRGWGPANLTYILRGNSRASPRGRASPQWGALAFRSLAAVKGLVDCLVTAGLLRSRQLDHGGVVLELSRAGRAALKDPARLQSLVSQLPSLNDKLDQSQPSKEENGLIDKALFERLRAWRRERSQADGVLPYIIAHDSVLKRIAASKPTNEAELASIKGIGPKKLHQYGAAILALVQGEEIARGTAQADTQVEQQHNDA